MRRLRNSVGCRGSHTSGKKKPQACPGAGVWRRDSGRCSSAPPIETRKAGRMPASPLQTLRRVNPARSRPTPEPHDVPTSSAYAYQEATSLARLSQLDHDFGNFAPTGLR
jgi:hypothetical protein